MQLQKNKRIQLLIMLAWERYAKKFLIIFQFLLMFLRVYVYVTKEL